MRMAEEWLKTWICLFALASAARPRFDVSTDMGMVLVPADAEVDTAIFRLRATDQDADFPLIFEIIVTTSPIVRVENLPCTLYNKVCQANVILTRHLVPGRLHDFVVRVKDSKGDMNSMQATISVTNATTPRDKIFPHLPSLIMVPEDTKPEKELDYLLVESNPWSGKPVYIELWQPKELFKIRQRQMGSQTKGIITLIGELDFETQSMYTLTMYATDPYTEPGKDTRNIAGLHVVVIVQDVQDVPPVFTVAPPLTKINNTVKPGDVILRVHAEDGDKGVPREVTYGLISEGNPFTPFFNVSETTGEIILARPLEELTKITHVGAPIVLKIVAEEIRTMRDEPPAQATVVELGLLLGEPGNSPPYFENDNYMAWLDENAEAGTVITFSEGYSTRVKDEDIGKAGVFALKLENNNGTFEISPAVAERTAHFVITVRDNTLIDYEKYRSLRFRIVAQEVGPATNLSASVPVTIFLRDVNDNPPIFDNPTYEITLSENANAGTRVVQVHATDNDAGIFGRIQYTKIIGDGSEAFEMNPDTGLITVSMGSILDREQTSKLELVVEARDEDGRGLRGTAILIVNILDVNDNAPIFEKEIYDFLLNAELTNFTMPAIIKAVDADAEPPNNIVRYEIVHGNYDNKFKLNEITGELMLREAINRVRKVRQNQESDTRKNLRKNLRLSEIKEEPENQINNINRTQNETNNPDQAKNQTSRAIVNTITESSFKNFHLIGNLTEIDVESADQGRRRRAEENPLFILTVRAYDLGVPHLSSIAQIRMLRPMFAFARIVMFVMPGENPDPKKTAETLATITGSRVTIQEIKPYSPELEIGSSDLGKRSVVVARVEQSGPGTLVDVNKIRETLAANGFGIIGGMDGEGGDSGIDTIMGTNGRQLNKNISAIDISTEEVTVYKAENKLLTWLLVLLGLLILAALITLIVCCICPSCPFYMEPRKRRIHSSETLIVRPDGRPKRHLHRKPLQDSDSYCAERKEAWSADPARQQWQFNRRNTKHIGIASLPGDVLTSQQHLDAERFPRAASLRHHDGLTVSHDPGIFGEHLHLPPRVIPMDGENDRLYIEDIEAQNRIYEQAELDSLKKHEVERGSDGILRNGTLAAATVARQEKFREQHFYRDGNAEVLRLITRGDVVDRREIEEEEREYHHANGKDILMQRFIEDQKLRRNHDLRDSFHESLPEADVDRSMESHQRAHETNEIIILPERLEIQRQPSYNQRQHQQEKMLNERLASDRNYKSRDDETDEYQSRVGLRASMRDAGVAIGEASAVSGRDRSATYGMRDVELVRQNALLTRLLLEKEAGRGPNVPLIDTSSFLETQSLPGQVAIATQTDRTAATQTDFAGRSRSDNEESEEDPRLRRKTKLTGKLETMEDLKKIKTMWIQTPIPEESRVQSAQRKSTPTKTKIEVSESRKISISPDVLKEISSSLKSGDSGDDGDEILNSRIETIKPDKSQKALKVAAKAICTNKKKVKESRFDEESTTPSPETKDKSSLLKGRVRKKIEKPPRKKFQKCIEEEKSNFMEPSFKVLEREISSFQQKIRQFGDKKLKKLRKDDNSDRKERESEQDDSGATYDVSKKCEVTLRRTKNSMSRENSPIKITVAQKSKSSEEESNSMEKQTKQQNVYSSDVDDLEKSKMQTHVDRASEKTRSRSQFRRQMHLENSDTAKSSSEKNEKSEDSTDKSKSSSSSAELKMNSDSSSSDKQKESERLLKSKGQEKKVLQSQRTMTKRSTGIIEVKKRITNLRSRTVEEPPKKPPKKEDGTKSLTSDESKLSSPTKSRDNNITHKKIITSAEEKSTYGFRSPATNESIGIDIDKLVEDVRGAVAKEISSSIQAVKNAIYTSKSEESDGKRSDRAKSPNKSVDLQSVQKALLPTKNKGKSQSVEDTKREMSMLEKTRMYRSIEIKDKKEKMKSLKEKSKSIDQAPSTKSDEAISFIVFENDKIKPDKSSQESERLENSIQRDISKGSKNELMEAKSNAAVESKEARVDSKDTSKNISNEIISVIVPEKRSSGLINECTKTVFYETTSNVQDAKNNTKETESTSPDRMDDNIRFIAKEVEMIEKDISDKLDESVPDISGIIDETEKKVSDEVDKVTGGLTQTVSNVTDNLTQIISNVTNGLAQTVSDRTGDLTQNFSDKTGDSAQTVSDMADSLTQTASDRTDDVIQNISDKTDDLAQPVSSMADDLTQTASVLTHDITQTLPETVINTQENIIDKGKQTIRESLDNVEKMATVTTEKMIETTDEIEETAKDMPTEMRETVISISEEIGEIKERVYGTIEETEQTVLDTIKDFKETTSVEIHDFEENVSNILKSSDDEPNENASQIVEQIGTKISTTEKSSADTTSEEDDRFGEKGVAKSVSDKREDISAEAKETSAQAKLTKSKSVSLPNEPKEQDDSKKIRKSTSESEETERRKESILTNVSEQIQQITRSSQGTERLLKSIVRQERVTTSESVSISSRSSPEKSPPKSPAKLIEAEQSDETSKLLESSSTPIKVSSLEKPIVQVIDASPEENDEEDDNSSCTSDMSSRTALRTQPYRTPRHSISSDGGPEVEKAEGGGEGRRRQRWEKEIPQAIFPQKIEVPVIDGGRKDLGSGGADKSGVKGRAEKEFEISDRKESSEHLKSKPVIVGVKRKEHLRADHFARLAESNRRVSPRREKNSSKSDDKSQADERASRTNRVEIRSKHLKLQVSHHHQRSQVKNVATPDQQGMQETSSPLREKEPKVIDYGKDPEIVQARSRYMAWYQQKRAEMEKKRRERKEAEEQEQKQKWSKKPSSRGTKVKSAEDMAKRSDEKGCRSRERASSTAGAGQRASRRPIARNSRLRIRPLVNVESEQLKAIVRQGRKMRKAEGAKDEDLPVQIFAPGKPPKVEDPDARLAQALQVEPRHHLTQHSEYKYEKIMPMTALPFYLHPPPPPPHPSPEHFQDDSSESRRLDDDLDSGIAVSLQSGTTRLKHQQVLDKKSVFDIAYNEASPRPSQLRSDSSTPPS